ncbi:cytochrome c oxidase subunit 3 [Ruania albidiflava]|uniref:aa3-type cytochrome oxidase subunit III n=1 Tax=Ruania albidiflava TaxID=366586 RepID=UPI0003B6AD20|nr:heme-copper oxidase subunit III [Ruania albidiflava]
MSSATSPPPAPRLAVNRPNLTQVGTIVWLSSELMFFAGLFAMYFTHQAVAGPEVWARGHGFHNVTFASINTLILVLSSVTCQMGVWAAEEFRKVRSGPLWQVTRWGMQEWYILSFLMGSFFIAGQVYEYAELVHNGLTIANSSYGSVFFIPTGFHGLHVLGGLIAFLFVLLRGFSSDRFNERDATFALVVSYYWHFVDAVWIVLFGTIYLLPFLL